MPKKTRALLKPLSVRPGVRYTCFGDGLCCTDIHVIGPITRSEHIQIRRFDPEGSEYNEDLEDYMLGTAADGGCVFLEADMRCSIHAEHGPEAKPDGCRQFPIGLVATPEGGRITTEHRCPCRTLGDRPVLTATAVMDSITDSEGDLTANTRVKKVKIAPGEKIAFAAWRAIEVPLLDQLAEGEAPGQVLGAEPFPDLKGSDWVVEALELIDGRDGTQFGAALGWFGDIVLQLVEGRRPRLPGRPWRAAFDRAEARSSEAREPRAMLCDWVADEIWSMGWNDDSNFAVARTELATRVVVAEKIIEHLEAAGARPDRAAAEAIMIIELVGESDYWTDILTRIRP